MTIFFTISSYFHNTRPNFLNQNLKINKLTNKIDTRTYEKPISNKYPLHADSMHPTHTKTGVIKSEFIRIKRTCSTRSYQKQQEMILTNKLLKQNYNLKQIKKIKSNIKKQEEKNDKKSDKTYNQPLIITHNNNTNALIKTLKNNWKNLCKNTPQIKSTIPLEITYKTNKSIKKNSSPKQNGIN